MPYTVAGKNQMLDNLAITHVSAHTADPTDAGLNEVSGGSYARQSVTYTAATGGAIDSTNTPAIPIPAGTTVTHIGYWSALVGGTMLAFDVLATAETFANEGTLTISDSDLDLNA